MEKEEEDQHGFEKRKINAVSLESFTSVAGSCPHNIIFCGLRDTKRKK